MESQVQLMLLSVVATFTVEGNAIFQLEVSENKDLICFPSTVTELLGLVVV